MSNSSKSLADPFFWNIFLYNLALILLILCGDLPTRIPICEGEKLSLPVIYPNYHTFVSENKIHKVPNRCVTLDFDLAKQGIDTMKARRIRSQVTCMSETICVCESFTKGNFWALCALGDTQSNHRAVANAVCDEVERRLSIYQVQIDRASCVLSQARFVVYDRAAVIKHPASCFYEPML